MDEVDAAKSYCDMVAVEWPSSDPVIWFEAPRCDGMDWRIGPDRPPPEVDEEVGAVLTKTFFLTTLKNRLLILGKRNGVCYSPAPVEQDIVWPRRINVAKKLCIPPLSSAVEATVMFANEVRSLWRDQSLVVYGFPSSNDFCINVLYTFGHLFEKVGLVNPESTTRTAFLFYSFRKWEIAYELLLTNLFTVPKDLLDLRIYSNAKQKNLYGSIFYSFCLYMNCILIKKQILDLIMLMTQPSRIETEPIVQERNIAHEHSCHVKCCSDCDSRRHLKKSIENLSAVGESIDVQLDEWLIFSGNCPRLETVRKSGRSSSFSYVEVSKFCSKDLLSDWEQLCEEMKHSLRLTNKSLYEGTCLSPKGSDSIPTSPKKFSWSKIRLQVKLMDFGMELWMNISDHVKHRRKILELILSVLENTSQDECIEMRGFPLLSEFCVSLIYVLAHMFEKVRFSHTSVGRNVIFFFKFRSYPAYLKEGLQESLNATNCVTSLLPLGYLFGGMFYENIKNFNTLSLQKQCAYVSHFLTIHKR